MPEAPGLGRGAPAFAVGFRCLRLPDPCPFLARRPEGPPGPPTVPRRAFPSESSSGVIFPSPTPVPVDAIRRGGSRLKVPDFVFKPSERLCG